MHILITRPEPDASEMKAALKAVGHEVSIDPVMHIEPLPIPASLLRDAQALIVTSRNGLRALAASEAFAAALTLPVFTVGPGSAELARTLGFTRVIAGEGSARELMPLIEAQADRAKGPLLHIAGEELAFDLAAALSAQGFDVRRITAYRAVAVSALSTKTARNIADGAIDAVILMSPRTAATFSQLLQKAAGEAASGGPGINESASRLTYLCLSRNVAEALGSPPPGRVEIAAMPNSAAMLAAVARVATQSTGV